MQSRVGLNPQLRELIGLHDLGGGVSHKGPDAAVERTSEGVENRQLAVVEIPILADCPDRFRGDLFKIDRFKDCGVDTGDDSLLDGRIFCQRRHCGDVAIRISHLTTGPHGHHGEGREQASHHDEHHG